MPRNHGIQLEDMLEAAGRVEKYIGSMSEDEFYSDTKTFDAVIRNLEIIGEAAKNVSSEVKDKTLDIEWKKIAGLRDILIYEYFGIDQEIVWDVVKNKIPALIESLRRLRSKGYF